MSKIKIITDSTSDLPKDLAKENDIAVIPLNIFFGEDQYKDGETITAAEVYGMMESGIYEWPRTSQPSAKEFMAVYNEAFDAGYDSIISIHVTQNMSGTVNSANLAKKQMPDKDIEIIDANTVAVPLGLIAYKAAKAVQEGKTKEEIVKLLNERYIPNSRFAGVVDTLENLHKGGRIGRAKKILGTLLNKKPLLQVKDGFVTSWGSASGHDEAFAGFVNMIRFIFDNLVEEEFWFGYTTGKEYCEKLYNAVKDFPNAPKKMRLVPIGPTVGVHLGPGAMTITWLGAWDEKWYSKK